MQPKRIIIAILAVILVTLSAISIGATSEAANEIAITVEATASTAIQADGTSVTVKAQDIIEVSVTAGEKSGFGITSLVYVLQYDADMLEYVKYENGSVYSSAYVQHQADEEMLHVSFLGDYSTAGKLATIQFRVKEGAHGTAKITMAYCHAIDSEYHQVKTNIADDTVVAQADAHAYGAGVVTEPNCTTGGGTKYTCTTCNKEFSTNATNPLGHTPGAAATCTTAQTCTVCSAELAPALGHTPGAAATCTTAQTCTVCAAELAPALGHEPGAAATCTTNQVCTREGCGVELAPATGHSMGEWVIDKEADIEVEGSKSQSCANCDYKITEKIPALEKPASFPWWIIVIVVVVLVGGFACYWFLVVKKKEN